MALSVAAPPDLRGLAAPLRAVVRAALAAEKRTIGELAIVLTDDADLRVLNCQWRGIDRATDVLSFSYDEDRPARGRAVNGDVVVSLDRVKAQARRFRVSTGHELARLIVHGALHLAGLDHERGPERAAMRRREDRALRACRTPIAALERALGGAPRPARRART